MTWKEFKEKVESAGVKDNMNIGMIDLSGLLGTDKDDISIHITEQGQCFDIWSA